MANTIAKAFAEWFMILGSIGVGKRLIDRSGKIATYLSQRSFLFFSIHFLWIVLFQYWFSLIDSKSILLLYPVSIVLAYLATFICSEICCRVPFLCFLMGAKPRKDSH